MTNMCVYGDFGELFNFDNFDVEDLWSNTPFPFSPCESTNTLFSGNEDFSSDIDWDEILVSPLPTTTDPSYEFVSSLPSPPLSDASTFCSPKVNPLGDFLRTTEITDFTPIQYNHTTTNPTPLATTQPLPPSPQIPVATPDSTIRVLSSPILIPTPTPKILPAQATKSNKRGPGRPPTYTKPIERTVRKRLHNDSASRSRARFSSALERLWEQIPLQEREDRTRELDPSRPLSRAEKIEIAVGWMLKLERWAKRC